MLVAGSVLEYCVDSGRIFNSIFEATQLTGLSWEQIQHAMDTLDPVRGCYYITGDLLKENLPSGWNNAFGLPAKLMHGDNAFGIP
eukprot:g594.t1